MRQLAVRARENVRAARPRFPVTKQRSMEIASAFFTASRGGDMQALQAMLAADVVVHADGGGKRSAALQPIVGYDAVLKLQEGLAETFAAHPSQLIQFALINGLPGFVTLEGDGVLQTTAVEIAEDKITAVYIVRNPEKLRHLDRLAD